MDNIINTLQDNPDLLHIEYDNSYQAERLTQLLQHKSLPYISYHIKDKYMINITKNNDMIIFMAKYYKNLDKQDESINYYEMLDKKDLTIDIIIEIILYYNFNTQYNTVIEYCLLGLTKDPNDAIINKIRYYLITSYYMINDYRLMIDNALILFEQPISTQSILIIELLGDYYEKINDIDNMIKYMELGSNNKSTKCMYKLGKYYQSIKNYDNMKKYYEMASALYDTKSAMALAEYYKELNTQDNMVKYYLTIDINKLSDVQLLDVANYYDLYFVDKDRHITSHNEQKTKEFNTMIKYYKKSTDAHALYKLAYYAEKKFISLSDISPISNYVKAAEMGHLLAMKKFILHHSSFTRISDATLKLIETYTLKLFENNMFDSDDCLLNHYLITEQYDKLIDLYNKYSEKLDIKYCISMLQKYLTNTTLTDLPNNVIECICKLDVDNMDNIPLYIRYIKNILGKELDLLKLHYKYAPTTEGYEEAKKHFIDNLTDK